jgi:hypothetical protein
MSLVRIVLVADVLHQFIARHETRSANSREWLGVSARIVNRDLNADVSQIGSRIALKRVKLVRVWMAEGIELEFVVEADGIDHQCFPLPVPD